MLAGFPGFALEYTYLILLLLVLQLIKILDDEMKFVRASCRFSLNSSHLVSTMRVSKESTSHL